MAEIGRKGFDSFIRRYFSGDRQQAGDWLRARAHEAKLESFVDKELARRLDQGERTACLELPILSEPDGIPF